MNPLENMVQQLHKAAIWERTQTLKRNQYLKVQGSTDTNLYFVESGTLRVFVVDANEEHTIRFGYQGNLIAALDSFIAEQPSDLYIQALRKTVVHSTSKQRYMHFVQGSAQNNQLWQELMAATIYQQMERERDLLTSSPQERYQRVLARSPQLFQEVPNKYIASYLRMTPETLSRIKKS